MFARPNSHHSQIAYVTNDLAAAMARLTADYGTPGFFEMSNIQPGEDPAGKPVLKIALALVGGVDVELIEPVGDTAPLFSDVLPDGEGLAIRFHHIAARIDGPLSNWDAHVAYIYTDERATLGHYVEHVWMSPDLLAQMRGIVPAYPPLESPS